MTGLAIWLTGLSGAGKSTLSGRVGEELRALGRKVELLDGEEVRLHLSRGLGFSKEDRDENVRRIGWVARVLARNGVVAVVAAISPYRAARDEVRRAIVGEGAGFVEVYVRCPLEVLALRDPKGLYKRALAGELAQFTGVSDPYEPPESPELVVDSSTERVEESVRKILARLRELGHVGPA